jgi:hypothetical protein
MISFFNRLRCPSVNLAASLFIGRQNKDSSVCFKQNEAEAKEHCAYCIPGGKRISIVSYGLLRVLFLLLRKFRNQTGAERIDPIGLFERKHGVCFNDINRAWVAGNGRIVGQFTAWLRLGQTSASPPFAILLYGVLPINSMKT